MSKNMFGLSRPIDAETKRKIRKNSRYSCVICRAPFCTYEHFNPEFKDATSHDPDGMCLLCGSCQNDTTAGRLSKETIQRKYRERQKEPFVKSRRENFRFFETEPAVILGGSSIKSAKSIICTDAIDCLSYRYDSESGAFLINMQIFDAAGNLIFQVVENTWESSYDTWDIELSGKSVKFRSGKGNIIFGAEFDVSNSIVRISHLDMKIETARVFLDNGNVCVSRTSKDESRHFELRSTFNILGCIAAIFIDCRNDLPLELGLVPLVHDDVCGITIARGRVQALIRNLEIRQSGFSHMMTRSIDPRYDSVKGAPDEAFVRGSLVIRHVKFPFWEEQEFYLNGIRLNGAFFSVHDLEECELGGKVEVFHIGKMDAYKFSHETGFLCNRKEELPFKVSRPHKFA